MKRMTAKTLVDAWLDAFVGSAAFDTELNIYYWRMRIGGLDFCTAAGGDVTESGVKRALGVHGYWLERADSSTWVCRAVAGVDLLRGFLHWRMHLPAVERSIVDDMSENLALDSYLRSVNYENSVKTAAGCNSHQRTTCLHEQLTSR